MSQFSPFIDLGDHRVQLFFGPQWDQFGGGICAIAIHLNMNLPPVAPILNVVGGVEEGFKRTLVIPHFDIIILLIAIIYEHNTQAHLS